MGVFRLTSAWTLFALSAALTHPARGAPVEIFRDGGKEWIYEKRQLQGWTVYIHSGLLSQAAVLAPFTAGLSAQLERAGRFVPPGSLAELRAVPIWVSDEPKYPLRGGEQGVITYHPDPAWLHERGLNPSMARGIHAVNPAHIVHTHRTFDIEPMVLLHELTHAMQDAKYPEGSAGDRRIKETYAQALKQGLYRSVPSRAGSGREDAYAASNHHEYFAELTEAYFGENDYCPRNRAELYRYDRRGLALIEKMWGVPASYLPPDGLNATNPCR